MKVREITEILESIAPKILQETYDNCGLLVGDLNAEVSKALICLDVTENVIHEAIEKKCELIISHHPIIFHSLKKITPDNSTGRMLIEAIKNNISIYAAHTNFDNIENGVNHIFANKLGLTNTKILSPTQNLLFKLVTFCPDEKADEIRQALFNAGAGHIGNYDCCSYNVNGSGTFRALENTNPYVGEKGQLHNENETRIEVIFPGFIEKKLINALLKSHPYEEVAYDIYPLKNTHAGIGAGMIGELPEAMDEEKLFLKIKQIFKTGSIRHSKLRGKKISKVAICGGSGGFLIQEAIHAGADIFITADVRYHDFFSAEDRMVIADIGHFESEQYTKELFLSIINKKIPKFAAIISEQDLNPVYYF